MQLTRIASNLLPGQTETLESNESKTGAETDRRHPATETSLSGVRIRGCWSDTGECAQWGDFCGAECWEERAGARANGGAEYDTGERHPWDQVVGCDDGGHGELFVVDMVVSRRASARIWEDARRAGANFRRNQVTSRRKVVCRSG